MPGVDSQAKNGPPQVEVGWWAKEKIEAQAILPEGYAGYFLMERTIWTPQFRSH
jgi:hypothetical protein